MAIIAWLAACTLLGQVEASSKDPTQDEYKKVNLPHHSFAPPLDYSSLLADWVVSGASIFEKDRLLLQPGVSERQGFAWNTRPLQTNNFEVTFHVQVSGDPELSKVPSDQSFAFWFVRQNISADFNESRAILAPSWLDGLKEQGYLLSGSKGLFEGVGVVFSTADADKKASPTISFVSNDNHQTLAYGSDVPSKSGKSHDFRNRSPVQLKFRVKPTLVQGHVIIDGSTHECFSIDRTNFPVKAGGYIGFTAWSGAAEQGKLSDSVSLIEVEVVNFDDEAVGEDIVGPSAADTAAYTDLMTEKTRHFEDQKSQTEHLSKITGMLSQYLNDNTPESDGMAFRLESMADSLKALDNDCKLMVTEMRFLWKQKEMDKASGKGNNGGSVQDLKSELMGLRRLLTKEGASHMQKLEAVQKNVLLVKDHASKGTSSEIFGKIGEQTAKLEKTVDSRGSQMSWMLIFLLGSIFAIGLLMWNRMTYYEKKHFI